MRRSPLLLLIIILHLLLPGSARRIVIAGAHGLERGESDQDQGNLSGREMMELDYEYARPNVNSKSGYLTPPAPPPSSQPLD